GGGGHDQQVEGVAVVGQGVRDETVVGRVEHRGGHEAIDEQAIGVVIDFVFDRRMVGRNLDGDVDVVRHVFAGRDFAVAHGRLPRGGPKKCADYRHIPAALLRPGAYPLVVSR